MPEAAIVILDNSDFSINGDYAPTRWLSQIDAAGLLIQTKMDQNHEHAMGIALSGGKQVEIICTPATDSTKVTSYLYGIKQHGQMKLAQALQTSALALKHRANPNLTQRIVCFVASTITDAPQELKIICKKLKKNNIALDLIAIGDLSQRQRETLQIMNEAVKGASECQLLVVEPGGNLSDVIFTSQILGAAEAGPNPNNQQMLNEENDPELMMALQLSLQEEEQRVAAARGAVPVAQDELEQQALQLAMQAEEEEKKDDKKGEDKDKKE